MPEIKKLLVANRSEIAIRIFRSATELGIRTVALYTQEDRYALHRFKADEAYKLGTQGEPIRAYLDIENIISVAKRTGAEVVFSNGEGILLRVVAGVNVDAGCRDDVVRTDIDIGSAKYVVRRRCTCSGS